MTIDFDGIDGEPGQRAPHKDSSGNGADRPEESGTGIDGPAAKGPPQKTQGDIPHGTAESRTVASDAQGFSAFIRQNPGIGIGFKAGLIAFLSLLFLIPLLMIEDIVNDRTNRRAEVASDFARSWGGPAIIDSPKLMLPVGLKGNSSRGTVTDVEPSRGTVLIQPEQFRVTAEIQPEIRQKGIYRIPLYTAQLVMSGTFELPRNVQDFGNRIETMDPHSLRLVVNLPDGVNLATPAEIQISAMAEAPADADNAEGSGRLLSVTRLQAIAESNLPFQGLLLGTALPAWEPGERIVSFRISLSLRGSESLSFVPAGENTRVEMRSTWTGPSFFGVSLPETYTIGDDGFSALWSGINYRNASWNLLADGDFLQSDSSGRFGVRLFQPVDLYQMTERSLKYGILIVALPFVVLFLFEVTTRRKIHPVQYVLIGLANTVFYLLLLSLSEHIGFQISYVCAALAVVVLVGLYVHSVVGTWLRAGSISLTLAALYGYMYLALQSEDYALLIGSTGLFAIIAIAMIITRRFDWYGMRTQR